MNRMNYGASSLFEARSGSPKLTVKAIVEGAIQAE